VSDPPEGLAIPSLGSPIAVYPYHVARGLKSISKGISEREIFTSGC